VPFINLAITASGASLSTTLPATISPSRLLQASTFLTAGDTQYSISPGEPVQIGTAFTLSVYMLFSGHATRERVEDGSFREKTWKEVIHKGRVKLRRVPLEMTDNLRSQDSGMEGYRTNLQNPQAGRAHEPLFSPRIAGEGKADEFAYELQIIEDLEDGRYHSTEDGEPQPSPCGDVERAGIREAIPIHQISKIFYADTGKILNIGAEDEPNSPVLLLKRDINAIGPRRMMEKSWLRGTTWGEHEQEGHEDAEGEGEGEDRESDGGQDEVNAQLNREGRRTVEALSEETSQEPDPWQFPQDLDPEWIAFEVWQEPEDDSDYDDEATSEVEEPSAAPSHPARESSIDPKLTSAFSNLNLIQSSPTPSYASIPNIQKGQLTSYETQILSPQSPIPFSFAGGPVKSSLSLLEMLIRLTALQQFQQCSHLSITDELLHFFLEESSTTGAGGDGEERRRKRMEARRVVGFDPYDESPVKRRGEQYSHQQQGGESHYTEDDLSYSPSAWPQHSASLRSSPMPQTPQPTQRTREGTGSGYQSNGRLREDNQIPTNPTGGIRHMSTPPDIKGRQGALKKGHGVAARGSPLGRGVSVETDSTLGTSPQENRDT
jgi:RanGTP-binding protein